MTIETPNTPSSETPALDSTDFTMGFEFEPHAANEDLGVSDSDDGSQEEEQNASQPPANTPPEVQTPSVAELQAQLTESRRIADTLAAARSGTPAGTPAPAEEPKPRELPYRFNAGSIPEPVRALLNSEDPAERMEGQALLMTAVANIVHKRLEDQVAKVYQPQFLAAVEAQRRQTEQSRAIGQQFYSTYPQLKTEQGVQTAQFAALQVMQERKTANKPIVWDKSFQDELVAKIKTIAPALLETKPAVPAKPTPPAKGQVRGTPGARPTAPEAGTMAAEIADLISGIM